MISHNRNLSELDTIISGLFQKKMKLMWEPSMGTSHMLRTLITDCNSINLQVPVAMQQNFHSSAYAQHNTYAQQYPSPPLLREGLGKHVTQPIAMLHVSVTRQREARRKEYSVWMQQLRRDKQQQ
jgi:hypothetical protein